MCGRVFCFCFCFLFSVFRSPFSVFCFLFSVPRFLFSVFCFLFCFLFSVFCFLFSVFCFLFSGFEFLVSGFWFLFSVFSFQLFLVPFSSSLFFHPLSMFFFSFFPSVFCLLFCFFRRVRVSQPACQPVRLFADQLDGWPSRDSAARRSVTDRWNTVFRRTGTGLARSRSVYGCCCCCCCCCPNGTHERANEQTSPPSSV